MNRDAQDNLLLLVGATMLAVGFTELHLRYVKPQMQSLIIITGLVLVGLGMRGLARIVSEARGRQRRATPVEEHNLHEHRQDDGHSHGPTRTAWLLALPLLVLYLVAPPSLGSYAASRSETTIAEPTEELPPLPAATDGVVTLSLTDYYTRVLYYEDSLKGAQIRMSGFVTPIGPRWFLTRMALACCAADGRPVKVLVAGSASTPAPAADRWVEVTGRYVPPEKPPSSEVAVATFEVQSTRQIAKPANPYE